MPSLVKTTRTNVDVVLDVAVDTVENILCSSVTTSKGSLIPKWSPRSLFTCRCAQSTSFSCTNKHCCSNTPSTPTIFRAANHIIAKGMPNMADKKRNPIEVLIWPSRLELRRGPRRSVAVLEIADLGERPTGQQELWSTTHKFSGRSPATPQDHEPRFSPCLWPAGWSSTRPCRLTLHTPKRLPQYLFAHTMKCASDSSASPISGLRSCLISVPTAAVSNLQELLVLLYWTRSHLPPLLYCPTGACGYAVNKIYQAGFDYSRSRGPTPAAISVPGRSTEPLFSITPTPRAPTPVSCPSKVC